MGMKHNTRYLVIALSLALLQACSNRQLYEAAQNRQKVLCQGVPRSEYQKCMEGTEESYDTYKQERESIDKAR
jgi:hypothetical protein